MAKCGSCKGSFSVVKLYPNTLKYRCKRCWEVANKNRKKKGLKTYRW